ncbi:hypothetical protein A2U01_0057138, partial [Trifolium medium]|nr:hypothetical protein [Trifolium medium]
RGGAFGDGSGLKPIAGSGLVGLFTVVLLYNLSWCLLVSSALCFVVHGGVGLSACWCCGEVVVVGGGEVVVEVVGVMVVRG